MYLAFVTGNSNIAKILSTGSFLFLSLFNLFDKLHKEQFVVKMSLHLVTSTLGTCLRLKIQI